jgi:hypothetical protein
MIKSNEIDHHRRPIETVWAVLRDSTGTPPGPICRGISDRGDRGRSDRLREAVHLQDGGARGEQLLFAVGSRAPLSLTASSKADVPLSVRRLRCGSNGVRFAGARYWALAIDFRAPRGVRRTGAAGRTRSLTRGGFSRGSHAICSKAVPTAAGARTDAVINGAAVYSSAWRPEVLVRATYASRRARARRACATPRSAFYYLGRLHPRGIAPACRAGRRARRRRAAGIVLDVGSDAHQVSRGDPTVVYTMRRRQYSRIANVPATQP